jgi:leader peptidase (prepilin peptidase)/N-methyltransferase
MMDWLFVFVLGLVTGSFLNACIYRIPRGISLITPPSRCPRCNNTLGAVDLVPVLSYLFLTGKCRRCRERISPRYPLVELACSTGFLILYFKFGPAPEYLAAITLFSGLVAISLIDLEHGIIPDTINLTLVVAGVPLLLLQSGHAVLNGLLGALLGGGLLLLAAVVSRGGMGGGDIKLAAVLGLLNPPLNEVSFNESLLIIKEWSCCHQYPYTLLSAPA